MEFLFYPNHEHACPHVGHCPHLGGSALGSVVLLANQNQDVYQAQLRTIDQLREEDMRKYQRILKLEQEVDQLKLELKLERQNKYKKNTSEEEAATNDVLVFLDHADVDPTNNLAERALRPLVVMRKLTYGSRSVSV